jgi:NitT/TauT family transport system ATP-binding protein
MNFELQDVNLEFKGQALFKDLNLNFSGPGVLGILGPSGCGKSTLIRLLAGLLEPTSGKIRRPVDLNQGFIFQESHLLNWRTTFENVNLPLELQKISNVEAVQNALQAVGLQSASRLYPNELSGGMKMRASLARAFVTNPQVLFCDEPFAALDEVTRENLQKNLRSRVETSNGICFFVTHNLSEALSVSDEIFYFKSRGRLVTHSFKVDRNLGPLVKLEELRNLVRGHFS